MTTIISVETLYEGWGKFLIAHVRLADGTMIRRQIEDHGRAIVVLPYDPARRCAVLIRQFRAPVCLKTGRQDILEAIAGIVEEKEDFAEAARREASEEAGLTLKEMEHVGCVWAIPGVSTERSDLFLAAYSEADRTGVGGGLAEEHEDITVVEMPLAELAAMADGGALEDMKAFAMVQTLRLRRPELFAI
jgi:nudix-type nucleoside diphosphatase (YffH/AdpP family)